MHEHHEYQTPEMTYNLSRLGYPLISGLGGKQTPSGFLSPEEAIVGVLANHPDPRYIKGIPVLVSKNRMDYGKLMELVEQHRLTNPHLPNKLGYMLDLTLDLFRRNGIYKDASELVAVIRQLDKIKVEQEDTLIPDFSCNAHYLDFARSKADEKMRKWHIIGLVDGDMLQRTLLLYLSRQNVQ